MNRGALIAFMIKELRHILRDRQTLVVLLLMPLVQVVLFGFALRSDVRDIRLVVIDPSPDHETLALRDRFRSSDRFRIVATLSSVGGAGTLFRKGDADAALIFESEFAGQIGRGLPARVQLVVDASDPNTGTTIQGYARAIISAHEAELSDEQRRLRI
ncbi:MAG TPA: ABC transporter permease, partial [Gemmatimonadaceae bacterium]|nr:ABC transporter permease [Gemmatimonadaceae bacterium]